METFVKLPTIKVCEQNVMEFVAAVQSAEII